MAINKIFKIPFHLGIILIFSITYIESAKILAIFPFPEPAQYIPAEGYLKTLATRGHELTVINEFPQKQKLLNFRDITIKYDGYEELLRVAYGGDTTKGLKAFKEYLRDITLLTLENGEVQDLLYSGKHSFDLVIVDASLLEAVYAIAAHFNAHLIGISALGTEIFIDYLTGNSSPISYLPVLQSTSTGRMNFWQRLQNLSQAAMGWYFLSSHLRDQKEIYRKYFPHLSYSFEDVYKNFSLVLLNQHFSVSFPRPYVPNMIEVGGLYIKEKTLPLPTEIEDFLNGAKDGVIYFSLGLNFHSKYLPQNKREAILKVFASLKQRVLWKYEDPLLPNKPDNVLISKWFPQTDILAHPKVILVITHGGFLSVMESMHFAKPILGIPVISEQFWCLEHVREMGCGLNVKYVNLNEQNFSTTLKEVLQNETYTHNAQRISRRYHDRLVNPIDTAIFWTEYVLRHNGADFMRIAARNLNFFQYHSLDTISFILIDILIVIVITVKILDLLLKLFTKIMLFRRKRKTD